MTTETRRPLEQIIEQVDYPDNSPIEYAVHDEMTGELIYLSPRPKPPQKPEPQPKPPDNPKVSYTLHEVRIGDMIYRSPVPEGKQIDVDYLLAQNQRLRMRCTLLLRLLLRQNPETAQGLELLYNIVTMSDREFTDWLAAQ